MHAAVRSSLTPDIADGLVFAHALDGPTSVRILTDANVERAGLEAPGRAAHADLTRAPGDDDVVPKLVAAAETSAPLENAWTA
ncbi:hypothetical protein ACFYRL_14775 [Streptomyces goshikiensis]|uniref:hypothetical protein n=1 Tax=Streptomyces goshikiensis TaxID=1942 RepID=UPI003684DA13